MRFNLKTGLASQKRLSASAVDFPSVNERYTGRWDLSSLSTISRELIPEKVSNLVITYVCAFRKQRYVYASILDQFPKATGIIKFDLQAEPVEGNEKLKVGGNVSSIFDLGPGRFGSEAIFVPRHPGNTYTCEEDDGYLIFFVHDENTGYVLRLLYFVSLIFSSFSVTLVLIVWKLQEVGSPYNRCENNVTGSRSSSGTSQKSPIWFSCLVCEWG